MSNTIRLSPMGRCRRYGPPSGALRGTEQVVLQQVEDRHRPFVLDFGSTPYDVCFISATWTMRGGFRY